MNDSQIGDRFVQFCQRVIDPYVVPVVSILGILGNVFSTLIIITTVMRKLPSSFYLVGLCCADALVLIVVNIASKNLCHGHFICPLCIFLQYTATFWSVWMLVAFTTERFIAVVFPLRQLRFSSPTINLRVICLVVLFGCLVSAPWLYLAIYNEEEQACSHRSTNLVNVLMYLESVYTFFFPLVVICVFNLMIIRAIGKSTHVPAVNNYVSLIRRQAATNNIMTEIQRRERVFMGITRTLLLVSAFFVACNLPLNIVLIILKVMYAIDTPSIPNSLYDARMICEYLYYLNFSSNILIYTFSSSTFRNSAAQFFRKLLCRSQRVPRTLSPITRHKLYHAYLPSVNTRRYHQHHEQRIELRNLNSEL